MDAEDVLGWIFAVAIVFFMVWAIFTIGFWLMANSMPRPYWMEAPSLLEVIMGQVKAVMKLRVI
jgi:hypothetical protein